MGGFQTRKTRSAEPRALARSVARAATARLAVLRHDRELEARLADAVAFPRAVLRPPDLGLRHVLAVLVGDRVVRRERGRELHEVAAEILMARRVRAEREAAG